MKNKIIATLVALGLVGSASAIEINENLSINGFVDSSYVNTDHDDDTVAADTQSLGIDEVELDFLFNAGGISGELHLDNDSNDNSDDQDGAGDFDIEQVHFSYTLDNGVSVTIGRFGSLLGFEREDPGGLFTNSRAYGGATGSDFNLGNVDDGDTVQEGIRLGWSNEALGVSLSLVNEDENSGTLEEDDLDVEIAVSYAVNDALSLGGGIYIDNGVNVPGGDVETDIVNLHATYEAGKTLFGVEYTEVDANDNENEGYLFLVDYQVSDPLGVAFRYSSNETRTVAGNANTEYEKITIAPHYAITESLGAILEYSDIDGGSAVNEDQERIAIELTFTF